MGKCKRKMADGGMVAAGQKQWQERLAEMWATKPKPAAYADGGAVAPPADPLAGGDPRVDLIAETEDVLA